MVGENGNEGAPRIVSYSTLCRRSQKSNVPPPETELKDESPPKSTNESCTKSSLHPPLTTTVNTMENSNSIKKASQSSNVSFEGTPETINVTTHKEPSLSNKGHRGSTLKPVKTKSQTFSEDSVNRETCISNASLLKQHTENDIQHNTTATGTLSRQKGPIGKFQKVAIVAGVEGKLCLLNEIAKNHQARAIIHTGNFGFYDADSHTRISISELKRVLQREETGSDTIEEMSDSDIINSFKGNNLLSDLPNYISGSKRLNVPVYVVWGQHEDLVVIEKIRKGIYHVPNLYILDHYNSYTITNGPTSLRLFGLGGSFNYPKLFDVGKGGDSVAGSDGKVWVNMTQIGELLKLSEHYEDSNEIRIFVCQSNVAKEPLAHIISSNLNADYCISSGAGSKICSIYDDFTIHTTNTLASYLLPTIQDIKSMWEQVYLACARSFSELQYQNCLKVVDCLGKDTLCSEQSRHRVYMNICSLKLGIMTLNLDNQGILIDTVNRVQATVTAPLLQTSNKHFTPMKMADKSSTLLFTTTKKPSASTLVSPMSNFIISKDQKNKERDDGPSRQENLGLDSNHNSTLHGKDSTIITRSETQPSSYYLFLRNLPHNISGVEVDETLLIKYDVASIEFLTSKNDSAMVEFTNKLDMENAFIELPNSLIKGRRVQVSRELKATNPNHQRY